MRAGKSTLYFPQLKHYGFVDLCYVGQFNKAIDRKYNWYLTDNNCGSEACLIPVMFDYISENFVGQYISVLNVEVSACCLCKSP
jgi:hypothetical protein